MTGRLLEKYPDARRQDLVETLHGLPVADPYRWLEEIDSPETQDWIKAERALTSSYLEQIPIRQKIARRLKELWNYARFGVPVKRGGRYFFAQNNGLQNQSALYWMDSLEAEPGLLLDPNLLSEDGTVSLMNYEPSEDGRLLAYGLSASGSDWEEIYVRRVESGEDLPDCLHWVKFTSIAWTHDNKGFFYCRYDPPQAGLAYKGANYYQKLYYHQVDQPQEQDLLVYERPDQKEWGFYTAVTHDGRYLVIHITNGTQNENAVFYKDLQSGGPVVELLDEFDAEYNLVSSQGGTFAFLTDLDAPMRRLIAMDIKAPQRENWVTIIPEGTDSLRSVTRAGDNYVAEYLHHAYTQARVFDSQGSLVREIKLPGIGTAANFHGWPGDPELFYQYASFTSPDTIYRYDLLTDQVQVFRQPKLLFNPHDYTTHQVFYTSKDGTRVPMFITHRKGLELNGDNPTYLFGYGGFDISYSPLFTVPHLVWMEMGGVFAMANLRGGGEYGKAWHEGGMKINKQNVFDDFIAAAEWLIENKYTRTPRLAVGGRSNGGLLTGACLTQRPDLFGAALVIVGVLDMLRFDKFTIGWAWVSDYGSPDNPEQFKALLAYSPYHNIKDGAHYPPTLITTGDHDDRVFPAHSFKFAAALQHAQAGGAPMLIRIDSKAGHGLGKPVSKLIDEWTDQWAFIMEQVDM